MKCQSCVYVNFHYHHMSLRYHIKSEKNIFRLKMSKSNDEKPLLEPNSEIESCSNIITEPESSNKVDHDPEIYKQNIGIH